MVGAARFQFGWALRFESRFRRRSDYAAFDVRIIVRPSRKMSGGRLKGVSPGVEEIDRDADARSPAIRFTQDVGTPNILIREARSS